MITKWYLWCAYNITLYQVKPGKAIQKNIDDDSEIIVINLYGDINDNNDNNNNINNINDNNNSNNNNNNFPVLCKISNGVLTIYYWNEISEISLFPLPSTSLCLCCWLWTYFTYFSIVSATEFEHAFFY